ncbi:hypothetical protein AAFF_G00240050 [Aldrovandia affinis]|uniref:Uncharacterized protein n=1 Tax=Aldrovandia affinis TaxID=143900 RepID=A0AAD7SUD0_9TELE|nr:hypothetical protein AAFF_G00240050 [Aldrovandia affinis]
MQGGPSAGERCAGSLRGRRTGDATAGQWLGGGGSGAQSGCPALCCEPAPPDPQAAVSLTGVWLQLPSHVIMEINRLNKQRRGVTHFSPREKKKEKTLIKSKRKYGSKGARERRRVASAYPQGLPPAETSGEKKSP